MLTRISAASEADWPNAFRHTPRMIASITWAIRLPPEEQQHLLRATEHAPAPPSRRPISALRFSRNAWSFARVFGHRYAMPSATATRRIAISSACQLNPEESPDEESGELDGRFRLTTVRGEDQHDQEDLDHERAEAVDRTDRDRAGARHADALPEPDLERQAGRRARDREPDELDPVLEHEDRP